MKGVRMKGIKIKDWKDRKNLRWIDERIKDKRMKGKQIMK